MRLIDADALYEQTAEWEATALHMVEKTMNDEDKTEWRRWTAILGERTAFKHDVADAPTIEPKRGKWIEDETGDLKCSVCGHFTCEIQGYWSEADERLAEVLDIPVGTRYHASTTPKYCSRCGARMEEE